MKKTFIVHPFLLAIFPILSLFSYNLEEASALQLILPIIVASFCSLVLFLSFSFVLRNKIKAGLITSFFFFLFFTFGHFFDLIDKIANYKLVNILVFQIGNIIVGPYKILLFLWSIFLISGSYFIIKTQKNLSALTKILNIILIFLVASSLLTITINDIKKRKISDEVSKRNINNISSEGASLGLGSRRILPDIYYIILDSYPSSATLKELYGYDNSEFYTSLKQKGFYVADKSYSNYAFTCLSLSSTLNMEYINYLAAKVDVDKRNTRIAFQMIQDSKVVRYLKKLGYKFVLIPSGLFFDTTRNPHADITIGSWIGADEFLTTLVRTTMAEPFLRTFIKGSLRDKALTAFSKLPEIPKKIKGPKFVFAHIFPPHPPFIFGPNGEVTQNTFESVICHDIQKFKQPYLDQVKFVNKKIEIAIDGILSESETPPIIILQGDHGPSFTDVWDSVSNDYIKERLRILNAYYLPNGISNHLYKSISPVNTFRLIFKNYLGINYDQLVDKSYYSKPDDGRFDFLDVTEIVK